ncbi:MAG TPA: outer membrane lipoprotein carrier protein LolA, partial [Caulobacteraceae bacterium]|nr:outer membrane lipoprotein carrier protein LolA [Caulobacteraceae bacterium]
MSDLTRRGALAALSTAALAGAALAAFPALADPSDEELVQRAIHYLDGLASVKGRFQQADQKGGTADGTFYMARPGRARFEYDAPSSLLITSDGKTVILTDQQRHTFQRVALASTPLGVFLGDHIRIDQGAHVTQVDRTQGGFAITAVGPRARDGQITLYFADKPLRLTGWQVTDA